MKKLKNIFGSAIFLAIGLVLVILTSYTLRPTVKDFFRARFTGFYAEEKDSLNVVGVGSSALYRYMNVPYLWTEQGITGYSWSTAGQSIYVIEYLLEEILKTQSPELLIVENRKFLTTEKETIKENRLRLVTDNMKYSWNRFNMVNDLVDGWGERLTYHFDLSLYHENWENITEESFSYMFNSKEHELKSWPGVPRSKPVKEAEGVDTKEEKALSKPAEETLLRIIEKCKENNVEVLFVSTPWSITEDLQKETNYMKRIVEENGCLFLDSHQYLEEMGVNYETDFYNSKHMNILGARKFTKFLGEYLNENYEFDRNHDEEVIKAFDHAAALEDANYNAGKKNIEEEIAKRENKKQQQQEQK